MNNVNIKYIRKCPNCDTDITYNRKDSYKLALKSNKTCRSCSGRNRKKKRKSKYTKYIIPGNKYGKWEINGELIRNGSMVPVKCECGYETRVRANSLINGKSNGCVTCMRVGKTSSNWKGIGDMPSTVYTNIKLRAKNRNKQFELSKKYLWNLFLQQNKKCALSGIQLDFFGENKPSLDRIDSNNGYVEGNVQWVYYKINIMKNEYSQPEFLTLCSLINEYNDRSKL